MIVVTRDARWAERLDALAARGGWPFAPTDCLPARLDADMREHALVVLDACEAGGTPARAVGAFRRLLPLARVVLACREPELGAAGAALLLGSGADELVKKEWPEARLLSVLGALRDAALAAAVRVSADGGLRAELRSRRAYVRAAGKWRDLALPAAEFTLLWRLLAREGEAVSREDLLAGLGEASGRPVEAETVSRRVLSLRRALKAWRKGTVETVRGGAYRLVPSSRRRSST